ncbi:MAG: bifunctional folylpolyglutamate synthase/dihydrofolate synthase [Planctomycetota bacterium]
MTSESVTADQAARQYLLGRIDYERTTPPVSEGRFPLDRMRDLLRRLGNPQDGQQIVHVTGTKGKGSTAVMIASMLSAAGYRTGLFTSPHLLQLEERFAIDGRYCTPAQLTQLIDRLRDPVAEMDREEARRGGGHGPTFFEITTAAAFLYFAQQNCQATVLEVGLGGRLDSTNVCQPLVSVITSISLDHTKQLGSTLAAIAREKAGIIKPGVPVVSGVLPDEPRAVIEQVARERGSRQWQLGTQFGYERFRLPEAVTGSRWAFHYWTEESYRVAAAAAMAPDLQQSWDSMRLSLAGPHQAHNATLALAATGLLRPHGFDLSEPVMRAGLERAHCPARVQITSRAPARVLDAAHNEASIAALLAALEEEFPGQRQIFLFAASRDKDVLGMLRQLARSGHQLVLTTFRSNPRATDVMDLRRWMQQVEAEQTPRPGTWWHIVEDPQLAWRRAVQLQGPQDVLCVTGSFFLVAELPVEARPPLQPDNDHL